MNSIEKDQLVIIPKQVFDPDDDRIIVYFVKDIDMERNLALLVKKCIISEKEKRNENANKSIVKSKWIALDKINRLYNAAENIEKLDGYDDYHIVEIENGYLIIGIDNETEQFFNEYDTTVTLLYAVIPFEIIQYQIPKMIREESPGYVWKKIYSMIKADAQWWLDKPYNEYLHLGSGINRRAKETREFIKDLMKKHNFSRLSKRSNS
jgi:hypothetical protein